MIKGLGALSPLPQASAGNFAYGGDIPAFTPAEAGTRFSDPRGMQG